MKIRRLFITLSVPLLLLPLAALGQLTAVSPDAVRPTQHLTGKPESVYVFFDKSTATLEATADAATDFAWYWLNPADTSLTLQHTESSVQASSFTVTAAGGYRVLVGTTAVDTFSCWVFFDHFKIDTIAHTNTCEGLRLEMKTTPTILTGYVIYHFDQFLLSPHIGDSTFRGVQSITWGAGADIHYGVDEADDLWKQRKSTFTVIDAPPPLWESDYDVTVVDVFGKQSTCTTTYTVPPMAAYAAMTVEEQRDNQWQSAPDPPKGEALYRLRFSHEKSLNAHEYIWKGFGNINNNAGHLILWKDSTITTSGWLLPRVPYKGEVRDGYVPGKYNVRLTVRNTQTGCADSTDLAGIEVDPSKFSSEAIPNAFTPNNDGQNDLFHFVKGNEPVSMEYIKVYIFGRSGALVYRYEGRADAWSGWNGRIMGTGGEVADGVYFYVISGEGWDGVAYDTSEYKGSVHIFR